MKGQYVIYPRGRAQQAHQTLDNSVEWRLVKRTRRNPTPPEQTFFFLGYHLEKQYCNCLIQKNSAVPPPHIHWNNNIPEKNAQLSLYEPEAGTVKKQKLMYTSGKVRLVR